MNANTETLIAFFGSEENLNDYILEWNTFLNENRFNGDVGYYDFLGEKAEEFFNGNAGLLEAMILEHCALDGISIDYYEKGSFEKEKQFAKIIKYYENS